MVRVGSGLSCSTGKCLQIPALCCCSISEHYFWFEKMVCVRPERSLKVVLRPSRSKNDVPGPSGSLKSCPGTFRNCETALTRNLFCCASRGGGSKSQYFRTWFSGHGHNLCILGILYHHGLKMGYPGLKQNRFF